MRQKQIIRINESQLNQIVTESVNRLLMEMRLSSNPSKANTSQLKIEILLVKQNLERVKRNLLNTVNVNDLMIRSMYSEKIIFYVDYYKSINDLEDILQEIENAGLYVTNHKKLGDLYIYEIDPESNDLTKQVCYYVNQLNILNDRKRHLELIKMLQKERDDLQ